MPPQPDSAKPDESVVASVAESANMPPPNPMRMNLMASIQGAGIGKLKKADESDESKSAPPVPPPVTKNPPAPSLADAIKIQSTKV